MKKYNESELQNGLKIISSYTPESGGVSIQIAFRAGSRYEKDNSRGYAHILEHLLFTTGKKYATETSAKNLVDGLGGSINATTDPNGVIFKVDALVEDTETILDLLADLLTSPNFRGEELEKEKKVVKREIDIKKDNLAYQAGEIALKTTFKGHPLSQHPAGDMQTVAAAKVEDIQMYYDELFIPERAAIVFAGGVDNKKAVKLADKYFGEWNPNTATGTIGLEPHNLPKSGAHYHFEKNESKNTQLVFNFPTIGTAAIKEVMALEILNSYVAKGANSLLKEELRMRQKLIYALGSANEYSFDAGRFIIQTSTTSPEKVVPIATKILDDLPNELNKQVLENAKRKTMNGLKLVNADPLYSGGLVMGFLRQNKLFTVEDVIKVIEKLTLSDVTKVAKSYLNSQNLILVALGPEGV